MVKAGSSSGLSPVGYRGWLFNNDSILQRSVVNSSYVKFLIKNFKDLTAASHSPPNVGLCRGINFQLISFTDNLFLQSCVTFFHVSLRILLLQMKIVPRSLQISCDVPLRFVNLLSAAKKLSAERLVVSSRWTALVIRHTNATTHDEVLLVFVWQLLFRML